MDTLDVIEENCRDDTPKKLIKMIDAWINSGGRGCTWGSLVRALNESGHRVTANKVIAMASEFEIQVTECLSAKSWQNNEATVCEHRELFQSKLQLANDSYQEFTRSLRELLPVPDTVEDTAMLSNIDIYIDGNCNFLCEFVDLGRLFVDVTEHLRTAQEHLHIWGNVLTKDNDMVCDRLRMLAIEKEELKEKLYLLAVKSQRHTEYDRQKRETQAKEIDQRIEETFPYYDSLSRELNSSLDHVQSAMSQNKSLIVAEDLIIQCFKPMEYMFLQFFIFLTLSPVLLFSPVFFNMFLTSGAAVGIIKRLFSNRWLRVKATRVLFPLILRGKRRRSQVSDLFGFYLYLNALVLLVAHRIQELQKSVSIYAFETVQNLLVGAVWGFTGAAVVRTLVWHIHFQSGLGIAVFVCCILITFFWQSLVTHISLALVGVSIGVMTVTVIDLSEDLLVDIKVTLLYFCISFTEIVGIFVAQCVGMDASLLLFFLSIAFLPPWIMSLSLSSRRLHIFVDLKVVLSIECLKENIHQLELIEKYIIKSLNKARSLKETLNKVHL